MWTPPAFRFRYYFDENKKILKNDYLFGRKLAGTATVHEKEDRLKMQDVKGIFHDEIRQVNDSIIIGKYYSQPNQVLQWLSRERISFLHIDITRPSVYLPYILKRVGTEAAFR